MRDTGVKLGLAVVLLIVGGAALYLVADRTPRIARAPLIERPADADLGAGPPSFGEVATMPAAPPGRRASMPPGHEDEGKPEFTPNTDAAASASPGDAVLDGTVSDAASHSDMTGFDVLLWDADAVESSGGVDHVWVLKRGTVVAPGRFHFDGLRRGERYYVGATALGFLSDVKGPVSPSLDGDSQVHLDLHTPGNLMVRVLDDLGRPAPGAAVCCARVSMPWPVLHDGALQLPYERNHVIQFDDGTATLRNLAPGEFWVAAGYGDALSLPLRVEITDGATDHAELVFQNTDAKGRMHAHVIDIRGKDVADARVLAKRILGTPIGGRSQWFREDDVFSGQFENLPVGLWTVSARRDEPGSWGGSMTVGIQPGLMTECTIRLGAPW